MNHAAERPDRRERTASLSDLMILVACVAGSLVLYRAFLPDYQIQLAASVSLKPTLKFYSLSTIALPLMSSATIAVPLLQIRRPRRLGLFRQPGTVACTVGSLALVFLAFWILLIWASPTFPTYETWPVVMWTEVWDRVAYAVGGAWLTLGMVGCNERKANWVDRLGIILGLAWLLGPIWKVVLQIPWF